MPKDTFFRLPDDKKKRILKGAKKEFINKKFSDSSINKIIKEAEIPRGSFYQYFEDKKDLYLYVIEENVKGVITDIIEELNKCNGDIFLCIDEYVGGLLDENTQKAKEIKMMFSENWVFESVWKEKLSRCEHEKNEIHTDLISKIDKNKLLVDSQEEFIYVMDILGAIIKDTLGRMYLHKEFVDQRLVQKSFHGKIETLRKHYCRE